MNPNNGAERKLTSDGTKKVWPRISPDGTQVLYQEVMGDGATTAGIYRVSLTGGDVPELINPIGAYPAWSTDSKSIACVVKNPAPDNQQTDDIAIVDAGNPESGAVVLTDHKQVVDSGTTGTGVQTADDAECGKVLAFTRSGSQNDGGLSGVQQSVDVSRSGHAALRLRMVAAIEGQDLAGDGWYDGETPVFVTIDYITAGGAAKTWTHGLLAKGEINYPQRDQLIPMGGWYQWDSPELLAALPDLDRITRITIGGSGWDFSSRFGLISLRGQ